MSLLLRLAVICIFALSGYISSSDADRSFILCKVCDSAHPVAGQSDDCFQPEGELTICRQPENNCISRYFMTSTGLRVIKGCASTPTCLSEWWTTTKNKTDCDRNGLVPVPLPGSVIQPPVGTQCSFCCGATGQKGGECDDDNYDHLHVATTTPPPTPAPTSAPTSASTLAPTTVTTAVTTVGTLKPVVRQCFACGSESGPPCTNQELFFGVSVTCPADQDYCMNDVIQNGAVRTYVRRCVDLTECKDKWFTQSSDNDKCIDFDPEKTTNDHFACHFCCVTDDCNSDLKPSHDTLWSLNGR